MPETRPTARWLLPLRPLLQLSVAVLGVAALGACDEGEDFNALRPSLGVVECVADDDENACEIDFGGVALLRPGLFTVTLENRGDALLTVETVVLRDSSDPAFAVVDWPDTLEPGATGEVSVRFTPTVEGEKRGVLLLRTDATNVPCVEATRCDPTAEGLLYRDLPIVVLGSGVDGALPSISVDKERCDFGPVGAGAQARCTVSVENTGEADLVIEELVVDAGSISSPAGAPNAFTVGALPAAVAPGLRASFDVTFAPSSEGVYGATLKLVSNDLERPEIGIGLSGEQVDAPTCQMRIQTINGQPVGPSPEVEPLDDVVVSVEGSTASSAAGQIIGVVWEFVERPNGSTIAFTNPTAMSTGFYFDGNVQGIDLAGHYRVAATVFDSFGLPSTNLCEVTFDAVPAESLLVQLGWDTPAGDMDLHLIKMDNGGDFCSTFATTTGAGGVVQNCGSFANEMDCHFGNCTLGGLDWDTDGYYDTPGDPSLDIDDLCGYGPENITVPFPEPGEYLVAVHYWGPSCGGGGVVGNTVRIYLQGVLALELTQNLNVNEWWEAAIVHWPGPGGVPCVETAATPGLCG